MEQPTRESIGAVAPRIRALLDLTHTRLSNANIAAGMWDLTRDLERMRAALAPADWSTVIRDVVQTHPLADAILSSPLACRARIKRSGQGVDAILLDIIYGIHDAVECDTLGAAIYAFERELPTIAGIRAACVQVRQELMRLTPRRSDLRVLALGCGHFRELEATILARLGDDAQIVAVDGDADCIASVRRRLPDSRVRPVCAEPSTFTARAIRAGQRFDLVYQVVPGATAQLTVLSRFFKAVYALLRPGGTMLLATAVAGRSDAGYLEACLGLWFAESNEKAMMRWASNVPRCREVAIYRDPHGALLFARLVRDP